MSGADFEALAAAVERLTLNDASVGLRRESSAALGAGFRCGCARLYGSQTETPQLRDQLVGPGGPTRMPPLRRQSPRARALKRSWLIIAKGELACPTHRNEAW